MKKLALIATLAALGLASCTPSAPASSSVEPEPATSSETPSSSSESPSSSSTGSSESTEKHDGDFIIEYEDMDLPDGEFVSEEEYLYAQDEVGANQGYVVSYMYDSRTETSDYELFGDAYGAYRTYEESVNQHGIELFQNRIYHGTENTYYYTSANGGHYGDEYDPTTIVDEYLYIYEDPEGGYYLYNNFEMTQNGIYSTGTNTMLSGDDPTEPYGLNWYYDFMVVYQGIFGGLMGWSSASYDPTHRSYVKDADGNIYDTNYYTLASDEEYTFGSTTKTVTVFSIAGTQWVYGMVEGIGYCMTKYTTFMIDYVATDLDGNPLEKPIVIYKQKGVRTLNYALEKPVYEGEALAPIAEYVSPYAVTMNFYDATTGEVSMTAAHEDITAYYKNMVDPDYEGYVYRGYNSIYNAEYDYYENVGGDIKVSIAKTNAAETDTPTVLGWNELTKWSDPYGYAAGKSETLENGIAVTYYVYRSIVKIDLEGNVTAFEVAYLSNY